MKKPFLLFVTSILILSGCSSLATQLAPTQSSTTETERATETSTPSPTATIVPLPTQQPQPLGLPDATIPNGFGVTIHQYFVGSTYTQQFILLQNANLGFFRDVITPGGSCYVPPWCFGDADSILKKATQLNLRVIFILNHQDGRALITPEDRQAFVRFTSDAVTHFKGKGVIWELWGEPDGDWAWAPKSDPQQYALLASETIAAMREADPNVVIIGPNVATLDTVFSDNSWRFLKAVGDAGVLTQFDAVNIHLHNGGIPESQIKNLLRLRRLIDSYSPDRKIPITSSEWGYTTGGEFYRFRATEDQQAKFLVRSWLVNISNEINLSIWYDWKDDTWGQMEEYDRHFGIVTGEGEPKPAYFALKTLTTTLNGHQFVRRMATQSSDDYLLLFRNRDSGILVAWTTSVPHTLIVPNVTSNLESIDMLSKSEMLKFDEQGLSLHLSDSPQYLLLSEGFLGSEGIFWKPEGTFFRLDNTNRGEIPITLENSSDQEQTFELQANLNDQIVGASEVTLEPHDTKTISLPVDINQRLEELDFLIKVKIANQDDVQTAWVWLQR